MLAALDHGGGKMMGAGHDIGDQLGFDGIGYRRLNDTDDHGGAGPFEAAEANCFADDAGIGMQRGGPETVREDDGAWGVGAVIVWGEQAPERWLEAHYVEIVSVGNSCADFARLAQAHDGEIELR